jgi:hypothetical protein
MRSRCASGHTTARRFGPAFSQLSVRDRTRAVEADRPVVYSNIAALMKAVENLPRSATEDDAPEASDRRVRHDLSDAFHVASGRLTCHY